MSSEDIKLANQFVFETTKVMLPVVTGFLVLFGSSAAQLGHKVPVPAWTSRQRLLAGMTIASGILSMGVWTGTMAFCIRVSAGASTSQLQLFGPFDPATNLMLGRYCAAAGHILFFVAVFIGCAFYWETAKRQQLQVVVD